MERYEEELGQQMIYVVPSIKMSLGGKNIQIKVKKDDVGRVVGIPDISTEAAKKALIAGVSQNGANRAYREQQRIEEMERQKQESKKPEKKFKKKYILPIAVGASLLLGFVMYGPNGILADKQVEHHIPVQIELKNIVNPSIMMMGQVGITGQEQITANSVAARDNHLLDGTYYKAGTHATAETRAVSYVEIFNQWKSEIDSCVGTLANKNATQEELHKAVERLLELEKAIHEVFETNQAFVEEYKQKFAEASLAAKDNITNLEIQGTGLLLELFKSQMGLSGENVEILKMLDFYLDNGYSLSIQEVTQDQELNYSITGDMVRDFVVKNPNLLPNISVKTPKKVIDTTTPANNESIER